MNFHYNRGIETSSSAGHLQHSAYGKECLFMDDIKREHNGVRFLHEVNRIIQEGKSEGATEEDIELYRKITSGTYEERGEIFDDILERVESGEL